MAYDRSTRSSSSSSDSASASSSTTKTEADIMKRIMELMRAYGVMEPDANQTASTGSLSVSA